MNDCMWCIIVGCDCCKMCSKYSSMNSGIGRAILQVYESEVAEAVKPVTKRWEQAFDNWEVEE